MSGFSTVKFSMLLIQEHLRGTFSYSIQLSSPMIIFFKRGWLLCRWRRILHVETRSRLFQLWSSWEIHTVLKLPALNQTEITSSKLPKSTTNYLNTCSIILTNQKVTFAISFVIKTIQYYISKMFYLIFHPLLKKSFTKIY